jgi:hypothetical protein
MSDRVIESIQEIVSKMNKAERGLFHILCRRRPGALSVIYRCQGATERPEMAFATRSMEESQPRP